MCEKSFLFHRTAAVLNEMRDYLKCIVCEVNKEPKKMIYFQSCAHKFCSDCLNTDYCPFEINPVYGERIPLTENVDLMSIYVMLSNLKDGHLTYHPGESNLFPENIETKENGFNPNNPKNSKNICLNKLVEGENKDNIDKNKKKEKNESVIKTYSNRKKQQPGILERKKKEQADISKDKKKEQAEISKDKKKEQAETSKDKKNEKAGILEDEKAEKHRNTGRNVPEPMNGKGRLSSKSSPDGKNEKQLLKRNKKGETLLHTACKKGDIENIEKLLAAGIDVNVQDHAKWTPLHDAIARGNCTVAEILIKAGASVNIAGYELDTPLHTAVEYKHLTIVQMLIDSGANPNIKNLYGATAMDMAKKMNNGSNYVSILSKFQDGMANLSNQKMSSNTTNKEYSLFSFNLSAQEKQIIKQMKTYPVNLVSDILKATHMIIFKEEDPPFKINVNFLKSLTKGVSMVTFDWINSSLAKGKMVKPDKFLFSLNNPKYNQGFQKAQKICKDKLPGIFGGCYFYFGANNYEYNEVKFFKNDLKDLIEMCSGKVLSRPPNPEHELEPTIPFHADPNGPLSKCSHYIIYQEGKYDPKLKYNMCHLKTFHFHWLVECILACELKMPD